MCKNKSTTIPVAGVDKPAVVIPLTVITSPSDEPVDVEALKQELGCCGKCGANCRATRATP